MYLKVTAIQDNPNTNLIINLCIPITMHYLKNASILHVRLEDRRMFLATLHKGNDDDSQCELGLALSRWLAQAECREDWRDL